ncbi:MAG: HNH endonuclease [Pirellulaceae bacterium]|nr:HNH endonuclease [Pirellulaceae bacterium]
MRGFWKIAPGRKAAYWGECRDNGCIAISWMNALDLRAFDDKKGIENELISRAEGASRDAHSIWTFVHEMKKGDIVVANDGKSSVKGIGVIRSDYLPPSDRNNPFKNAERYAQVRLVDWKLTSPVVLGKEVFNIPTVQVLRLAQVEKVHAAYLKQFPNKQALLEKLLSVRLSPEDSAPATEEFVPSSDDERSAILRRIMQRRGQQKFRRELLTRYQGKCVVTGCGIVDLLEAAHIHPHLGAKDNVPENGLLLRADIHTLFDLHLLAIDPKTLEVVLASKIANDSDYKKFASRAITFPRGSKPSIAALKVRYDQFLAQQ